MKTPIYVNILYTFLQFVMDLYIYIFSKQVFTSSYVYIDTINSFPNKQITTGHTVI